MKIDFNKTKTMVFNTSKTTDLVLNFVLDGIKIEQISDVRLLGIQISNDMKWKKNTLNIVKKASQRLWILRRLKNLGADTNSLKDVYVKQIRSILEFGVPAWQGGLTLIEKTDIERVQKCAAHIMLGKTYSSYEAALKVLGLEKLEVRRVRLCLSFAIKAEKHPKFQQWFIPNKKAYNTRNRAKYKEIHAKHARYAKSPLAYLTKLLNAHHKA